MMTLEDVQWAYNNAYQKYEETIDNKNNCLNKEYELKTDCQKKINLMNELTKIKNVMRKVVPDAPHEILLVLDGSTGQNAYEQARQFVKATEVTALAVTKLDGTAKGGVVIGISHLLKVPVKYIGLGEKMTDLQPFNRRAFVDSLFGDKEA